MKIHDIDIQHLSYSSVALWHRCPREWLLKYKYGVTQAIGVALPFGTAMHRAIQSALLTEGVTQQVANNFCRTLNQALIESKMQLSETAQEDLTRLGTAMLADKTTQFILNSIHIPGPECVERKIEFRVPGVDVPVVGYIDLIDNVGQLYDLKTSKWGWDDKQAQDELQPDFYLTAMDDLGDSRHEGMFNHVILIKNETAPVSYVLSTYRGDNYKERVYEVVRSMWRGLKTGGWDTSAPVMCQQCRMQNECSTI